MFEARFYNFSKRENSTARPDLTAGLVFNFTLKDRAALNSPDFRVDLGGADIVPFYNYCYVAAWDRYYFINDWTADHNLWIAHCSVDVLATYKDVILASTQFVSYSSVSGSPWLADTRVPVLKDVTVGQASAALPIFISTGIYILSCIGKTGSCLYALSLGNLKLLIASITNDDFAQQAETRARQFLQGGTAPLSAEDMLGFATLSTQNDLLGNAYGNAPSCLRSCIYVPFSSSPFAAGPGEDINLGNFNTGVTGTPVNATPATGSISVGIPWHYSDWRRGYCEQVYLYLPLVGMVSISSDNLTHTDSITVNYSYTCTDGVVAYQIVSGGEIIGSYGGSCAINYPLGINQQPSAGQVMQTLISGTTQNVSGGLVATRGRGSAGGLLGAVGGLVGMAFDVLNETLTSHPSCVGGIGGGAGSGLSRAVTCYTVAHSTVIEPTDMAATMGVPTMKPLQLSSCSGYCQCANAHVSAEASLEELSQISALLNSGFFIE